MPSQFDRPNVLVIGGAGFVGSNLCDYLLGAYNVVCVDNYSSGSESEIDHLLSHDHFEFVRHDITQPLDFKAMQGVERFRVQFVGVSHVVFCANLSSPDVALAHPVEYLMVNATGLKHSLELALSSRARFLYLSDASVYHPASAASWDVSDASSLFAEGKRFGERLTMEYRSLYSLPVSIVRLYPCYGINAHAHDMHLIPWMVRQILQSRELRIPSSLLGRITSLVYVRDAVDALEKIMTGEAAGIFDVGSPTQHTIREIAEHIGAIIGGSFTIHEGVPADVPEQILDLWKSSCAIPSIQRIKEATGWFPVVLLDDGLQKTIDYYKALRGMKRVGS